MRQLTRGRRGALLAALLAALAGCTPKEAEFFTFVGGGLGEIVAYVDGTPDGAMVRLVGEGVDVSGLADDEGHVFQALPPGSYTLTVTPPAGYTCMPTTTTVTITDSDLDGEAVFTCSPQPGTVTFTSTGLTGSTTFPITLMDGTTLNGSFGSSGASFTNVHPGDWSWALGVTAGYDCTPDSGTFTLAPGGSFTQGIDCLALFGALSVAVTGTGTTHAVNYTGPENGSVQAGETPVVVQVVPGQYTLALGAPSGYTCPSTQQATVTAGGTANVTFACTAQPGTITVTQTGAPTATVGYTGPTNGSVAAADGVATPVNNLPAGTYTFNITNPGGYTCAPASVQQALAPGGSENVAFTCTPAAVQPQTVSVSIGEIQGSAGAVPANTYPVSLRDGSNTVVGNTTIRSSGGNNFIGFSPTRLGLGSGAFYRLDLDVDVSGQPFNVVGMAVCTVNGAVSGGSPFVITYRDAAEAVVGTENVTSVPTCVWSVVPGGARYADFTWPNAGFVDFNGLQLWRP